MSSFSPHYPPNLAMRFQLSSITLRSVEGTFHHLLFLLLSWQMRGMLSGSKPLQHRTAPQFLPCRHEWIRTRLHSPQLMDLSLGVTWKRLPWMLPMSYISKVHVLYFSFGKEEFSGETEE